MDSKNLCEYGFNFKEESFTIIVPENESSTCNFFAYQSYYYEARNKSMLNLFAFNKDFKIKNLNVPGPCGKLTFMKITLHESSFDKDKYIDNNNKFVNTDELFNHDFWKDEAKLYESDKLILETKYKDPAKKLTNITDYFMILETDKMKIRKDKVYALIAEFGPNPEYNYLYHNSKESGSYTINENLRVTYASPSSPLVNFCILNGFDYKLE